MFKIYYSRRHRHRDQSYTNPRQSLLVVTRSDGLVRLLPRRTYHEATSCAQKYTKLGFQTSESHRKWSKSTRNHTFRTKKKFGDRERRRKFENVSDRGSEPREARVALSLMMLTSSTSANSLNIARS